MNPDRVLFVALAVGAAAWLKTRRPGSSAPDTPTRLRQREPEVKPGLSRIDADRLRDDHGHENRYRSAGQIAGRAKIDL